MGTNKSSAAVVVVVIAVVAVVGIAAAVTVLSGHDLLPNGGGKPGPIEVSTGDPGVHDVTPEIKERLDRIANVTASSSADGGGGGYDPKREREWITSGPFQIDRSLYALGESIFVRVGGIPPEEKGQMAFLRPLNDTHKEVYLAIPFDGADGNTFNQYFTPQLSKARGICSAGDLAGEWVLVFRGTDYQEIGFAVSSGIVVPGQEDSYEPVC